MMSEYWTICAEEALEAAGLSASPEQLGVIAEHMETAHGSYAEQHGHVEASRSLWSDLTRRAEAAEAKARAEAEKVPCPQCEGKSAPGLGGTIEPARYTCWKCGGTGKVGPDEGRR